MTHHHFRLQRADGFKCYADNDQDGGTTHCQRTEVRVHPVQCDREDRDDTEEECTHQSDLGENTLDIVGSRLTRTNARNAAVALTEVVGDFDRIILHGHIEVVECNDQNEVDQSVGPSSCIKEVDKSVIELLPEAGGIIIYRLEQADRAGQRHKGHGEDDRHNAAHADLDRNVCGLTAILLSADNTFCVLDRDPAFGSVHEDNESDHCDEQDQNAQRFEEVTLGFVLGEFSQCTCHNRKSCENAGEQEHGDTVSDTLIVDLVAHPYDDGGTCDKGKDDDKCDKDVGCLGTAVHNCIHNMQRT